MNDSVKLTETAKSLRRTMAEIRCTSKKYQESCAIHCKSERLKKSFLNKEIEQSSSFPFVEEAALKN